MKNTVKISRFLSLLLNLLDKQVNLVNGQKLSGLVALNFEVRGQFHQSEPFLQFPCDKNIQTQIIITEKLRITFLIEKLLVKG